MGKKMFFLDLDGTVLDDAKEVPEENVKAIKEVLDAGDYVAIATGRPFVSAKAIAERLGMMREQCYLISFNGALIYDLKNESVLRKRCLPDEIARYLFAEGERENVYLQAYTSDCFLAAEDCPELEFYHNMTKTPYRIEPDLYHLDTYQTPKVLALTLGDTESLRDFQREHLAWEKENHCVSFFSSPPILEYCSAEATKESGIAFFEDYLGIAHEDTVAAGDAGNDLSMILAAGIGVAMKNATDEVKAAADYITDTDNNDGGVAEALRRFCSENSA